MRRVRKGWLRLFGHLGTLFLSILMGTIVWLIAINQENPLITGDFQDRIAIRVRGLPDTLLPLQDLGKESVHLKLRAPKSSWNTLKANDISAYVDLTGLKAGLHDVPVRVSIADPYVTVTEIQREQFRIQLDALITKTVPVHVELMDAPAFGFDSSLPVITPSLVTVRGPASQVEKVSSADTQVYLHSAQDPVEHTQAIQLVDENKQSITQVEAEPPMVNIVVPVERGPGRKEVAVRVDLKGQPASGYRLSSIKSDPDTVVLRGSSALLNSIPGFVATAPLALDGAKVDIYRRLALLLPKGVTAFEGNTVSVVAGIAPIESTRTVNLKPVLRNLAEGRKATVAPDTLDLIISGPLPMLASLGSGDMFVILDLKDLIPGTHIISPTVALPAGVRQVGVLPAKVEVVISAIQPLEPLAPGTIPPMTTPAAIRTREALPTPSP
jgi:YbbR domain-containing protein